MRLARRLAAFGAMAALLGVVPVVLATTGPTDNLKAPKELVPSRYARIVVGHWLIDQADQPSRIRSGQLAIDFAPGPPQPFLVGNIFMTQYDASGQPGSFLANLYPFKVRDGRVLAEIRSQASLAPLGRVVFDRDDKAGADVLRATITVEGDQGQVVLTRKPHKDVVAGTLPPVAKPLDSGSSDAQAEVNGDRTAMYAPVVRAAMQLTGGR